MGLYLPPLRIIAPLALGVNSLKHAEEHSVRYEHEAATTHRLQEELGGTTHYTHHILLLHGAESPHIVVMTDWLTPALNSWVLHDSRQKYWTDERQIDDYVFLDASWGLSHFAVAQSSSQCVDAEHLTSNPEVGYNLISFLLTLPGLFLCDMARLHCDKSPPWMEICIIWYLFVSACCVYIYLDGIWPMNVYTVGRKGKRRCDDQCVIW